MKKLLWIFFASLAMACGDGSGSSRDGNEAAAEEDVDVGSVEEISPQLELDSTETRFDVDSLSSTDEAKQEADRESF